MDKQERAKLYMDYLTEEGYSPKLDAQGDVAFKAEGKNYCICVDEKDDMYFQLLFPNFWKIESPAELERARVAANSATGMTKTAKIYVRSDNQNVEGVIEMFVVPPESFKPVFKRCMGALQTGVSKFVAKMQESAK